MRRNLSCVSLALALSAGSLEAQEQYPRFMPLQVRTWPDSIFPCRETGTIIPIREEFGDGRSEITPRMRAEIRGLLPRLETHMRTEPDYCFIPIGAANNMLWNRVPTRETYVHQGNDDVVSRKRAYVVGSELHQLLPSIGVGRIRLDILPAELPKSTAIALGKLDREKPPIIIPPDTSGIGDLMRNFMISVNNKMDSLRQRIRILENPPPPPVVEVDPLYIGIAAGGGFDVNSGYNMPIGSLTLIIGKDSTSYAEVTAWSGLSPNEGEATLNRMEVIDGVPTPRSLSSKLTRWGHGTRFVANFAYPCGPMIERFKYETLVRKLGEFSETKRGTALGAACNLEKNRFSITGSGGYEFYELKEGGGLARDKQGFRFTITARYSIFQQGR